MTHICVKMCDIVCIMFSHACLPSLWLQTRILVTHGLSFLPQCDLIVVLREGKITEMGLYGELMDSDSYFAEFVRTYTALEENDNDDDIGQGE